MNNHKNNRGCNNNQNSDNKNDDKSINSNGSRNNGSNNNNDNNENESASQHLNFCFLTRHEDTESTGVQHAYMNANHFLN